MGLSTSAEASPSVDVIVRRLPSGWLGSRMTPPKAEDYAAFVSGNNPTQTCRGSSAHVGFD
jgi:hypothetical protein